MMDEKKLWIYSTIEEQRRTAGSLIGFGVEQYKLTKVIQGLPILEEIVNRGGSTQPPIHLIMPFVFSWLTDTIKIIVFFENYMKAELILNGFLVHKISNKDEKYKDIMKEQKKRPIKLKELHDIEPFIIDESNKTIEHEALSFMTLGFNELTIKEAYRKFYQFDMEILEIIKSLNLQRNKLHFLNNIEFSISISLIEDFKKLDLFVTETSNRLKQ